MFRSPYTATKAALYCFCLSLISMPTVVLATTPHLNAVENALQDLAPGSEGSLWERTNGHHIDTSLAANWLQQSPDCWGNAGCDTSAGANSIAAAIYDQLAQAREWIDITTLVTFPDGIFQQAMVDGIKAALNNNPDITIRILAGTPPGLGNFASAVSESAHNYMDRLTQDLGPAADDARIIVAGVETSWLYSWNHAKIIAVDGKTAMVGGHNWWESAYTGSTPISDVSMTLSGPAAVSAHKFADELWDFACTWSNSWWNQTLYVDLVKGDGFSWWSSCPKQHRASRKPSPGQMPALAIGGLGFGMDVPGGSNGGLQPANDSNAACSNLFTDYVNNDAEYSVANPEEHALRALIASAREHVFLSQQDLIAPCVAPIANAYYDARLFDILADKLIEGIPVTLITSTPGANQGALAPYANAKALTDVTDILIRKVEQRANVGTAQAKSLICSSLQYAPIRIEAGVETWDDGKQFGNHAKVISVDNAAFYIGSKNLYPATLQDFGFIIEDEAAAESFKTSYQDPAWNNSRTAALVDFETGVCQI